MHFEPDKPWKNKRSLCSSDNEEGKDSSAHKKVRISRTVPWVRRDSTASLSQGSSGKVPSSKDTWLVIEKASEHKQHSRLSWIVEACRTSDDANRCPGVEKTSIHDAKHMTIYC